MADCENMKEIFFNILNRFGKISLNIGQLRCFKRSGVQTLYWNGVMDGIRSTYKTSLEDCLQFLEGIGEKEISVVMRNLPLKVKEYTNGGVIPILDRFFSEIFLCISIYLLIDDGLVALEVSTDVKWNNINIKDDTEHSFYLFDDSNSYVRTDYVPIERIDSIYEEICDKLEQTSFSPLKMIADIKTKLEPKKTGINTFEYVYDILEYFPSLFEISLFREIGDKVVFGTIQGRPIIWTIYNIDRENYAYLLVADYILCKSANGNMSKILESCYLDCFSEEEKSRIIEQPDTTRLTRLNDYRISDKHLFLLSSFEFYKLFPNTENRVDFTRVGRNHIQCWLREHDDKEHISAAVTANGEVTELDYTETAGIRPALWMSAF